MLFLFTIDPKIFSSNIDKSLEDDLNDIFLYWKKVGVLVVLNPEPSKSLLYKSIKSCEIPSIKQKWSSGLIPDKMRQISTECNYEDLWNNGSVHEIFIGEDKVEIAVISEKNIKNFKLKLSQLPAKIDCIDYLCTARQFRRLDKITDSETLCNMPLPPQLTNSEVWSTRYRKIINYSKTIHIYDRYCIDSFINKRIKGNNNSGLEQFIRQIANNSSNRDKYIKIRSAIQLEDEFKKSIDKELIRKKFNERVLLIRNEMNEVFKDLIATTSVKEIDVQLVLDKDFGSIEHYRHIRFDDYNIIVIDKGLSHFEGSSVRQTTPFQYLPWRSILSKSFEEDEKLLDLKFHSLNGGKFTLPQLKSI
jgi:hypothetical protein